MARNNRRTLRGGRRGRRGKGGGNWGLILAAVAAPLLLLGGGGYGLSEYMKIEQPGEDLCYPRADQDISMIFLDASVGKVSKPQMRDYRTGYLTAWRRAKPNTKLLFVTTAADVQATLITPVFTLCKPASTPEEQAALGAPEETAQHLAWRAEQAEGRYLAAVDEVLAESQDKSKQAGDSPILEQLRQISKYDGFQAAHRSLTIITDGIENSSVARFCTVQGNMPPFAVFAKSGAYESVKPRAFDGTDVLVLLVEKYKLPQSFAPYCTNAELRHWWLDYFAANDAASVDLTPLRHWAGS